jgi:hypothetical protein
MDLYAEVDNDIKLKYKEYIGVDANSTEFKEFTMTEQADRYGKNLAFWMIENSSKNVYSENYKNEMRSQIVEHNMCEFVQMIDTRFKDRFGDALRKLIFLNAGKYYEESGRKITDMRKTLSEDTVVQQQNTSKRSRKSKKRRYGIIKDTELYKSVAPKNEKEQEFRKSVAESHRDIKQKHCAICGDTEEVITLVEMMTVDTGKTYLCITCKKIQLEMYRE